MGASRLASARLPTHPPARPPRSSLGEVGVANVQKGLGGPGGHAAWAERAAPACARGWCGAGGEGTRLSVRGVWTCARACVPFTRWGTDSKSNTPRLCLPPVACWRGHTCRQSWASPVVPPLLSLSLGPNHCSQTWGPQVLSGLGLWIVSLPICCSCWLSELEHMSSLGNQRPVLPFPPHRCHLMRASRKEVPSGQLVTDR